MPARRPRTAVRVAVLPATAAPLTSLEGEPVLRRHTTRLAAAAVTCLVLTACGGLGDDDAGGGGGGEGGATITIGYVTPQTGPLAPFGAADTFVVQQMSTYFATNRLTLGGQEYSVDIMTRDTQSDVTRAAEVTTELINDEAVDLVLAASTPETVNPVSETCEANAVPCITTVAPWQTTWFGRGKTAPTDEPFEWGNHFFWGLEDVEAVFQDIWTQVDPTLKQAGALWPNDGDGNAWSSDGPGGFPAAVAPNGYTIVNPGLYETGTPDFTAQIGAFRDADAQILLGVPIPPDFTTFWQQAKQQGYTPRVATIGKALLFPSSVEALGDTGSNLSTEVWWTPQHPFTSSITDQTAQELADQYEQQTGGQWTQPIGFVHALFEVAVAALTAADGTDKAAVRDAVRGLTLDTVVGTVDWTAGPTPNIAKTPLVGGQWRADPGGPHPYRLVVVSNTLAPEIPTGGTAEPLAP